MTGIVGGRRKSPNRAIIGPVEVHIMEILFALLSDKTLYTRIFKLEKKYVTRCMTYQMKSFARPTTNCRVIQGASDGYCLV